MAGTVNVSRDLWNDPTFKDSAMSQREAWIWLIAEASWKARKKRIGSVEVVLQRGQLAASTRFMAKAWTWSEPRVRRYLDMLESRRMIRRATDAGVTAITICKYDDYQNGPRSGDATSTQQPAQDRRTIDANEKKGEIRDIPEANASGRAASAEPELKKTFWDNAKAYLKRSNVSDRNAGSFIGKCLREHGLERTRDAFKAAQAESAAEPIPWITAKLTKSEHQSAITDNVLQLALKMTEQHAKQRTSR